MSVIEFWRWTPAWHWVLPVLALAVIAAFTGARLVLAEEARRLDGVEWDTDWHREPVTEDDADQIIAEWHDDNELPLGATFRDGQTWDRDLDPPGGRPQPGERFPVAPHAGRTLASVTAGQAHLDDFDWLVASLNQPDLSYEDRRHARLEYVAALAWDAKVAQGRCWEILHVEFPRLRAELARAA